MSAKILIVLAAALLLASCVVDRAAGPTRYRNVNIDGEGAESVHVAVHMGAGELRITDGAQKLLRGDFAYSIPSWEPVVRYTRSGGHGNLTLEQPKDSRSSLGNNRYTWDLQLSNKIPMDMEIHFGAGDAKLDLGSLDLRGLEVHMGVGEIDLDLRGALKHSYDVAIHGGIGQATVHVPSDEAISASAHGGIGSIKVAGLRQMGDHWESDTWSSAANRLRLEVHGGIGEVRIVAN